MMPAATTTTRSLGQNTWSPTQGPQMGRFDDVPTAGGSVLALGHGAAEGAKDHRHECVCGTADGAEERPVQTDSALGAD